jgi:L-asparagine oxygenase
VTKWIAEHEVPKEAIIALTDEEARDLKLACADIGGSSYGPSLDSEPLLTEAEVVGRALPARLVRTLGRFRRGSNHLGVLVVRNVPVDDPLVPTPQSVDPCDWRELTVSTVAQLAISSLVGEVIAFADEKQGQLIQEVVPIKGAEQRQENSGSTFLELHTEDGFHPFKPDFITLLCLRPDHDRRARTITGSFTSVLPRLSARSVRTLREPLFRIRHSTSFVGTYAIAYSPPRPVLTGPSSAPEFVADFHLTEPIGPEAEAAFAELGDKLLQSLVGMVMDRGDLIIVDNRVSVHGRTAFTARYDGADRWLRRCYTVADLRPSRGARPANSRVCVPLSEMPEEPGFASVGAVRFDEQGIS